MGYVSAVGWAQDLYLAVPLAGCGTGWATSERISHYDQWWAMLETGLSSSVVFTFFSHHLDYHTDAASIHLPAVELSTYTEEHFRLSWVQEL